MTNGSGQNQADPCKRPGEEPARSLAVGAWLHLDVCQSGWVKADFSGNKNFPAFWWPFANQRPRRAKHAAAQRCGSASAQRVCAVLGTTRVGGIANGGCPLLLKHQVCLFSPAEKVLIKHWLCSGHSCSTKQEKFNFLHFLCSEVFRGWDLRGVWGRGSWHPGAVP